MGSRAVSEPQLPGLPYAPRGPQVAQPTSTQPASSLGIHRGGLVQAVAPTPAGCSAQSLLSVGIKICFALLLWWQAMGQGSVGAHASERGRLI